MNFKHLNQMLLQFCRLDSALV